MGRGEGNVAEKRFLARTFVNKLNGFPADEICHITFFANSFPTAMPIELLLPFVGKVVESPVVASGEMGEAAIQGEQLPFVVSQMPLAKSTTPFVSSRG